ncbi:zona pellucida sperm-binding protein 4-like [Mugil cephalus]|uniref:zona pellucida sperm-binding protein 4-like n=1 Tax=Mugil cephalus TaxID=48193 RepID=UPI001FB8393E|nr:zona pellucida sperm-binding protein 4-like [Mugil cephalus]
MNYYYYCAKLCVVALLFTTVARRCLCVQRRKTPERRPRLAVPTVTCSSRGIKAVFGPQVNAIVCFPDLSGARVPVSQSEGTCGVRKSGKEDRSFAFYSRYDSCYSHIQGSKVVIPLQVQLTGEDRWTKLNISCPLIKRRSVKTDSEPTPSPGNCDTERDLRVDCGDKSIYREACIKLGCCFDSEDSSCFYKLNACSLDGHFVFTVHATDTQPPIDPGNLIIKDQPHCLPAVTTADTAVFKIGAADCGAKMKADGDMLIYEVDVEEWSPKSRSKHFPFSLQVECEYEASDLKQAAELRSWFAVTDPPPVVAQGTIKVQMRIATDSSFKSFVPEDQLPVTLLLGQAVNVEVSLVQPSPDPSLSLRVRDCFAFPASRRSVWTLLYDGCPNPLDDMRSSVPVDDRGKTSTHSQTRRFDVKTFAFLNPETGHPSVEEMYFYCWVEICTDDIDCSQRCSLVSSEGERQRREAISESHPAQLVFVGPLKTSQNNTEPEDGPCQRQNTMFQVTVYVLAGVSTALLLLLIFIIWSRCRRTDVQQTCDAAS